MICHQGQRMLSNQNSYRKLLQITNICDFELTKLFFAVPCMKEKYKLFNDVVLIDATYKTNKYQIPLLVFSGITAEGRNTIFGLALINDETAQTYIWALQMFLDCHDGIKPLFQKLKSLILSAYRI